MPQIEGIEIRNFRSLRKVTLGRLGAGAKYPAAPLPKMLTAIGPNGAGKSTLIDAFGFLGDCLRLGVETACDMLGRGGFDRLRTQGQDEPIRFQLFYRQSAQSRPVRYTLAIDAARNRPFIAEEKLEQARKGTSRGRLYPFLDLRHGRGHVWAGESTADSEGDQRVEVKLQDQRELAVATLGNLAEHPRIVAFRDFLEGWYLSYFVPDSARRLPMAGAHRHLDRSGENLANYVQYMERENPDRFHKALRAIQKKIPGIATIEHERQKDGRLLLKFSERGYTDPFYAADMSDGTLKMLTYLLLLEDPEPAPLIGIEEPENGLHHQLLEPLAAEMKRHAERKSGPQILVTTHSPNFVDALAPEEVWVLHKNSDGSTEARRAADLPSIGSLVREGIPLGSLWYSNHFGVGNP